MADNELGLRYWASQRLTRRRLLGTAAVGGAALAAAGLVGCSGDGDDNGGTKPAEDLNQPDVVNDGFQDDPPKKLGGILRVRQAGALPSMNPFGPSIFALAQGLTLGFTVFDHMWYTPTDTGIRELFLATSVEQPDPLTVIAKIGDATFHDKPPVNGRKVTAEDIAESFKRFREEIPIGYDWLHNVMEDIVATDESTVKITQKFPWAWVFTSSNAGSPWTSSILPREILHGNDDLLRTDAIGSGHWQLAGHENGSNIKLRKFANFRQFPTPGLPRLDGVDFKLITDEQAALAAFKSGELDTTGFSSRKEMEDTANELGDKIVTGNDLKRDYLCMMLKYEPPFTDIRVRQAFNLLIDRDEAAVLIADGDAVKCPPVPPAHVKYTLDPDDKVYKEYFRHDVGDAKKLLEAASFDFDQEIEFKHSVRPIDSELAQVLKEQLARGGVKVKLVSEDLVRWFSQSLGQGNFHITAFQHLAYEDPDLPLRFYLGPEGDRKNFMGYKEPKVDEAVLAAARELEEGPRIEKVKEAQRVIMREYAPMLNLFSEVGFGARYAYVKGTLSGRGSLGLFNRTAWLDKA